ncbi:hypothetical protein [Methanobrevibacter sp. DSM 116169]|uniref:hypothetical protein n=1 Tax=Methanobrevibacter sp. DSM 116169 TaxID=3242727 RepID=UPI0038FC32A3
MIEDNIQVLRQAAKISQDSPEERLWCVIAGNDKLVDDIAYRAIASKHNVKILFREHVILKEDRFSKKFDFIMLNGLAKNIYNFKEICKSNGGAFIQISPKLIANEPNLMVFVAPDDIIKKCVNNIEQNKISFGILSEDQTTGFIEADLNVGVNLPNFAKSALKPFYNVSDVVLSLILVSVDDEKDIDKVQSIATQSKIFVIDFKDINMED